MTEAHASGFRNLSARPAGPACRAAARQAAKPDGMLAGLAGGADAVLFIGHHGKGRHAWRGARYHTIAAASSPTCGARAARSGRFRPERRARRAAAAPAVLVSGDDTVAAEATSVVPGIHAVVVKRALGFQRGGAGSSRRGVRAHRAGSAKGTGRPRAVQPLRFEGPVVAEVDVLQPRMTERALLIPGHSSESAVAPCATRHRTIRPPTRSSS